MNLTILDAKYDLCNKEYGFGSLLNRVKLCFIRDRRYRYIICRFQKYMRYSDYYWQQCYDGDWSEGLGKLVIANDIIIGAGIIVVSSFTERV